MLDSKKEKVSESKESSKVSEIKSNPLMSFKSGSSSGVGASASTDISGPSISKDRAKASSNSNQLGSILAGKTYNNSGRAPVWAAPAMANVSAFKESEEAKAARELEEKKRLEEIEAKKAEEEKRQGLLIRALPILPSLISPHSSREHRQDAILLLSRTVTFPHTAAS